jgi:hypothetical protein
MEFITIVDHDFKKKADALFKTYSSSIIFTEDQNCKNCKISP